MAVEAAERVMRAPHPRLEGASASRHVRRGQHVSGGGVRGTTASGSSNTPRGAPMVLGNTRAPRAAARDKQYDKPLKSVTCYRCGK